MSGSLRFVSNFHKAAFHILKKKQESCIFNAVRHIRTSGALRLREGIQFWSFPNVNQLYYNQFVPVSSRHWRILANKKVNVAKIRNNSVFRRIHITYNTSKLFKGNVNNGA